MDFNQFINQEASKLESVNSNFNQQNESYKPKHSVLRLGNIRDANGNKTVKENALVRVLPPTQGTNVFFKEFRTTGINYSKKDGSQGFTGLTLPAEPGSSVIDPYIQDWLANDVQFSRFPNKPGVRYYIHVIEYFNNNGQLQPKTDSQGNIMIQPMELSNTGYKELLANLKDPMLKPSPNAPHSFISANEAFLVNIAKAKKGEMSWKVSVYPNAPLGALPQGWEEQLSDLDQLAKPTEEQNPNFVNFLINNVNNTELSHDNFKFNRETNVLGEEPSEPKQEPTQQEVDSQMPSNIGGQQAQGTQQSVNNTQFGQGTSSGQQPSNTGSVDWNNLAQQQSQPNSNPFNGFDVSSVDDSQVPFETQAQNTQQAPEQQQTTQEPPKQKQTQSIDDVLGGLDLDNL
uniref:SsDNA binding protein n=1 Tax=Staphylococcus phage 184DA TaxID=3110532 RepID=A0AAU6MXA6_9CAUD